MEILAFYYLRDVEVNYSNVTNSYFKNGFAHLDEKNNESGIFKITHSNFENNTSESGTIVYVPYTSDTYVVYFHVYDCTFTNNTASKFGGVIYSVGKFNNRRLNFTECYYYNNHAKFGNIIYTHSNKTLLNIGSYIESIDDVSTIPAYFATDGNIAEDITILSGGSIPEGIMFKLYDDYGNQLYFPHKTSSLDFEDLVLFNVEVNDTYNAKVIGQTKDYCWDDVCVFPPVKVIGNPGVYTLSLKFKSSGIYPGFVQDSADIEIKIMECNETEYLNQPIGNTYLKSCYSPKCEMDCNHNGQCINNDLCYCDDNFIGKYCNENVKLERISTLDLIFNSIGVCIIFIIIILIGMIIYFRNHTVIKGGGVDFLILMLIGLIINIVNTKFLTLEKSTDICYQTYLFSNTGFSIVFGSIFVKSYRIHKIFCQKNKLYRGFKKSRMFLIIGLMTLFHWLMAFFWYFYKGITVVDDYTSNHRKFVKCEYHQSKNLSAFFNFVILVFEFVLSYSIRKVDKKFKEDLAIPAYVYIIYMVFMYVIGHQDVVNVVIRDYFDIIGTIINTIVCIYYLFIVKFIEIFTVNHSKVKNQYVQVM